MGNIKNQMAVVGILTIAAVTVIITVAWAAFNSTLSLEDNVDITVSKWDIEFTTNHDVNWNDVQVINGYTRGQATINSNNPLAGIDFQKDLEEKAFVLGGSNYFAPVQRFEDFDKNVKSEFIGKVTPSYKPGFTLSNLNDIIPKFVSKTLKDGIKYFDTKLHGFANPDSILTGMETRSSSPVKILRNEKLISNIDGIYPCGEGAGYAGGIMTAAVDGIKCAISVMER